MRPAVVGPNEPEGMPAGVLAGPAPGGGARQRQARRHGIFGQLGKDFGHGAVEVDFHHVALALFAVFLGYEFARVRVEFLNPQAVAVDFGLDVAVGRAAYAHADGARCAVTRQSDYADVVGEVLAAELRAEAEFFGSFLEGGLKLDVAEGVAVFVAVGGQAVEIFHRCLLHNLEVLFG